MSEFLRRLKFLIRRHGWERDLQDEMDFHREMMEREGRHNFGNTLRLREASRDAWGWTWLDQFCQDVLHGARLLRRAPVLTFAATLILALGIGVNLTAFNALNTLFLKPLPVRDPDSIVRFTRQAPGYMSSTVPYPALEFYSEHNEVLSSIFALTSGLASFGDDSEDRVRVQFVTANYFSELGANAAYGQFFYPAADVSSAEPVAVLAHRFWERRLGSERDLIGKTIRLNGKPVTIFGVAPYEFTGLTGGNADLWIPISKHPYVVEGSGLLTDFQTGVMMYGRLKPGVSRRAAEEGLKPIVQDFRHQHPEQIKEGEWLAAQPGAYLKRSDHFFGQELVALAMTGLLTLVILTVCCASVGSLLLARAMARGREFAIRAAVGAGRMRLVRQVLTESLLLGLLGTALSIGLSMLGWQLLLQAADGPHLQFTFDYRVFLFTLALTVGSTALFGLAPALQVARRGPGAYRKLRVLIGLQVAGSCILLITSGLLVRGIHGALSTGPGFEYRDMLAIDPSLYNHGYKPPAAGLYLDDLRERLEAIHGIDSVALTTIPPFGDRASIVQSTRYRAYRYDVDSGFFSTMAIPILKGRNFQTGDRDVVIISETLAGKLWPDKDPIGRNLRDDEQGPVVIGVSGPARIAAIADAEATELYFPLQQDDLPSAVLLVRATVGPERMAASVRVVTRSMDHRVAPTVTLLRDAYRNQIPQRAALVVTGLGVLAALLAAAGVYGMVHYAVVRQQKEIGLRMALGARAANVISLVLHRVYGPMGIGILSGIAAAAALSMLLRGRLFGLSHLDPLSYAGAVGFFLLVAGLAAFLPARRALRINPFEVLRND